MRTHVPSGGSTLRFNFQLLAVQAPKLIDTRTAVTAFGSSDLCRRHRDLMSNGIFRWRERRGGGGGITNSSNNPQQTTKRNGQIKTHRWSIRLSERRYISISISMICFDCSQHSSTSSCPLTGTAFFLYKNQIKIDLNVWANQEKRRGMHMPTEFFSNFSLIIKPSQLVRATERALNWTSARSPVDWRATRTVGRLLRHSPSGRNRQLDCGLITCSIFLVDQVPRQIDFQ